MILNFKAIQTGLFFCLVAVISSFSFAGIQYIDMNELPSQSSPLLIVNTPQKSSNEGLTELDYIINHNATINKLDPLLIKAIIKQESDFNMLAVSPKGARGLMQLLPTTALMYGNYNLFNPQHNIEVGSKHFAYLLNKYGKIHLALAAYNAGEGNVAKYGGLPPFKETQDYVYKILKMYNAFLDEEMFRIKRNALLDNMSTSVSISDPTELELQPSIESSSGPNVLYLNLAF